MIRPVALALCLGLAVAQLVPIINQGMTTAKPLDPVCLLAKDVGPCKGLFQKVYFNKETMQCENFLYGGCYGNGNNFEAMADCMQTCGSV